MSATLIDGKAIAARMRDETRAQAQALAEAGWTPRLVSISVGDVAAAELYVRNQQRSAEAAGVAFEARNYPEAISLEQLTGVIQGTARPVPPGNLNLSEAALFYKSDPAQSGPDAARSDSPRSAAACPRC